MRVLQLTAHFRPNIGGVETHLNDLVDALIKHKWVVTVLTYGPLTTKVKWQIFEKNNNFSVIRIPWIPYLFYLLVRFPLIEFLYLLPGLFFMLPIILIIKSQEVIHAHGLVAGFVAVFWGRIFGKKILISTHSIYSFPKKGYYRNFAKWILENADYCMGLSKQATDEILSLGISQSKVKIFTYWVDLEKFKKIDNAKDKLRWNNSFTVLFVGRLIEEKGLNLLLESAKNWNQKINLVIVGSGPLESKVRDFSTKYKQIKFIGAVNQDKLSMYYSGANILIIPSITEEGYGRVILESLACGTPVIGGRRGGIPEVINTKVGKLIDVNPNEIKQSVEFFYYHRNVLTNLAKKCRKFAERRYSEKNAETIIRAYQF